MAFSPSLPFNVPMTVLKTTTARVNGVLVKARTDGRGIYCSFRTFGGTERERDGVTVVEDTAVVQTWYGPDVLAGDALRREDDGSVWEILGTPEDVGMRHQWMQMKVRRAQGGA